MKGTISHKSLVCALNATRIIHPRMCTTSMRYLEVDVTGDGNCFYYAVFGALRERRNDLLYNVWTCLSGPTCPSRNTLGSQATTTYDLQEERFMRMLRDCAARYIETTEVDNPVDMQFATLLATRRENSGQATVQAILGWFAPWYSQILRGAMNDPSRRPYLRAEVAVQVRTSTNLADQLDVQVVQVLLALCGINLRIVNNTNTVNARGVSTFDPSNAVNHPRDDAEIVLVHALDHYHYMSILEYLNGRMLRDAGTRHSLGRGYAPQHRSQAQGQANTRSRSRSNTGPTDSKRNTHPPLSMKQKRNIEITKWQTRQHLADAAARFAKLDLTKSDSGYNDIMNKIQAGRVRSERRAQAQTNRQLVNQLLDEEELAEWRRSRRPSARF